MNLMRRICRLITRKMRPRTIRNGKHDVYLERYYLLGAPRHPDGEDAFDAQGNPRPGTVSGHWQLVLHRFAASDDNEALHNHPWEWAKSLILAGGYLESRRFQDSSYVYRQRCLPGHIVSLTHDTFHAVELLETDCWTLFLMGPRVASWLFWLPRNGQYVPWREYLAQKMAGRP
jgi:hypothetical protein